MFMKFSQKAFASMGRVTEVSNPSPILGNQMLYLSTAGLGVLDPVQSFGA
jgi:hypothetical protein